MLRLGRTKKDNSSVLMLLPLLGVILLFFFAASGVESWVPPSGTCSHSSSSSSSLSSAQTQRGRFLVAQTQLASSSSSNTDVSASSDEIATLHRQPRAGDVVTLDCRLVPEGDFVPEPLVDGVVLHSDDDPVRLRFVLGGGNYLPGLHDLAAELQPGDRVDNVSLDAGWGARHANLEATLTYESAGIVDPARIRVGVQLHLQNGLTAVVTAATATNFTMDANPPLAGASYAAEVTLVAVEEGPRVTPYQEETNHAGADESSAASSSASRYQVATFALGCFWGAELEFMRTRGVVGTAAGYTQGRVADPTYEQVCTGETGHAEAVAVAFDPAVVRYEDLVRAALDRLGENKYLRNQVGNDRGTQYRHGVYYHTPQQKVVAEAVLAHYGEDCVTECLPAAAWYAAEDYHQQYLLKGGQSARKGDPTAIRCYG